LLDAIYTRLILPVVEIFIYIVKETVKRILTYIVKMAGPAGNPAPGGDPFNGGDPTGKDPKGDHGTNIFNTKSKKKIKKVRQNNTLSEKDQERQKLGIEMSKLTDDFNKYCDIENKHNNNIEINTTFPGFVQKYHK